MNVETVEKLYQLYELLKGLSYQYNYFTTAPVKLNVQEPVWLDPHNHWQRYPVPNGALVDIMRRYIIEDIRLKIQTTKQKIVALGGELPS